MMRATALHSATTAPPTPRARRRAPGILLQLLAPPPQIPPNVVNQTIVRGKHLLKEMRRVMVEKLGPA